MHGGSKEKFGGFGLGLLVYRRLKNFTSSGKKSVSHVLGSGSLRVVWEGDV